MVPTITDIGFESLPSAVSSERTRYSDPNNPITQLNTLRIVLQIPGKESPTTQDIVVQIVEIEAILE